MKALKLLFLCLLFVAIGVYGINSTTMQYWITYFLLTFFGLGFVIAIFHLLDKKPQIIINEVGIYDRSTSTDIINWEIIKDAYSLQIYSQNFICLVVDECFKPSRKKGILYRKTVKLSEFVGAQELNLSISSLRVDKEKILAFILLMIHTNKNDKVKVLEKYLSKGKA